MTEASLLPILFVPDPRLRAKAKPVAPNDPRIPALAEQMLATMYKESSTRLLWTVMLEIGML
jgi:peptide deformylase